MAEMHAEMPGTQRAAVFLMVLGEEVASEVLKHLGPKEVQKIGTAMAALTDVNRSQVQAVVDDFGVMVEEQTAIGIGSDQYLRNVMVSALGEERASSLMDQILVGGSSRGLESLKWMDARAVADIVRMEHPQIVAILISYLDSDHAAAVLGHLPDQMRGDVITRIATLEAVQPAAIQQLDEILEQQFSGKGSAKAPVVGGLRRAADILNFMDSSSEEAIFEEVRKFDDELCERIQELMFTFDNLVDLEDRAMQRVLRELSSEQLVPAMKGASQEVQQFILRNMSKRAGETLMEDIEARGPIRVSDVEAAHKEVLAVVRRLSEEGEIVVGGKGGEQYV